MTGKASMVLVSPPFTFLSARVQASSAHNLFLRNDIDNAVNFTSSLMASVAHYHICCSELLFIDRSKSRCARMMMAEDVEGSPKAARQRALQVLEVEERALVYKRSLGMYNRDPCRKDLLHVTALERAIHFWKKGLKRSSSLGKTNYIGSDGTRT